MQTNRRKIHGTIKSTILKIGLYFGSFNPIHIGHLLMATHIREGEQLDEIWFVVSPQNPFKKSGDLANESHRLEMVKLAVKDECHLKVTDIEYSLPKPSYTCLTLKELTRQFPEKKFYIIIGEDAAAEFNQWREATWIEENYEILVYNRTSQNSKFKILNSKFYQLPMIDISSTEIRNRVKNNLSIHYFVTDDVEQYIGFHNIYH